MQANMQTVLSVFNRRWCFRWTKTYSSTDNAMVTFICWHTVPQALSQWEWAKIETWKAMSRDFPAKTRVWRLHHCLQTTSIFLLSCELPKCYIRVKANCHDVAPPCKRHGGRSSWTMRHRSSVRYTWLIDSRVTWRIGHESISADQSWPSGRGSTKTARRSR